MRTRRAAKVVRDQSFGGEGVPLQKLAHQFQRSMLVSLRLDGYVKDVAFSVDDRARPDAKSYEVLDDASVGRPRSSVQK